MGNVHPNICHQQPCFDPLPSSPAVTGDAKSEEGAIVLISGGIFVLFFGCVWLLSYVGGGNVLVWNGKTLVLAFLTLLAIGATVAGGVLMSTHDDTTRLVNDTVVVMG